MISHFFKPNYFISVGEDEVEFQRKEKQKKIERIKKTLFQEDNLDFDLSDDSVDEDIKEDDNHSVTSTE